MSDLRDESDIDFLPEGDAGRSTETRDDDARGDIEQAVDARRDALENGEGDDKPGLPGNAGGSDGIVKNQDGDAQ